MAIFMLSWSEVSAMPLITISKSGIMTHTIFPPTMVQVLSQVTTQESLHDIEIKKHSICK